MFPNTLTIMSGFFQKLWPGAGLSAPNNAGIEMLCITAQKAEENARKILDKLEGKGERSSQRAPEFISF
ncbi:uncharacterized protein FIESC28_04229 [Fusarium coffeatum]|uniref:Uncharacterized protein n=1 Tax=Fusarium coffeatum TaxID=231269 RepID=A0A366S0V6_9HYPO|nr:uncharacterized protein FIESC28_04229 [Fusarium coffeatum]RBR22931.1 hypothetical protein FIESC28_04229 [Fusarium coffeatum]